MARARIRWYGERVKREIREEMKLRLAAAGDALLDRIRQNISTSGPPASLPGEMPHKQTGGLIEGLYAKLDRRSLSIQVGNTAEYALMLEEGTADMAARPHMRKTMLEMKPTLRRILIDGTGAKRGIFKFEK